MGTEIISNLPVPQNFFPEKISITGDHYVMGASILPKKDIMPNGHGWGNFLPIGETQNKNNFDPQSCPVGGTYNAIEGIGKKEFSTSFQNDLSERYGCIMG